MDELTRSRLLLVMAAFTIILLILGLVVIKLLFQSWRRYNQRQRERRQRGESVDVWQISGQRYQAPEDRLRDPDDPDTNFDDEDEDHAADR